MEFEVGDTVQLKSGGPIMTVEEVGEQDERASRQIYCVWFEKVASRRVASRDNFPAAILTRAQPGGFAIGSVMRG